MVRPSPRPHHGIDRTRLRVRSGLSLGALGAVLGIAPVSAPVAAGLAFALAAEALGRTLTRASSPLEALAGWVVLAADLPPERVDGAGRRAAAALEGGLIALGASLLLTGSGAAPPVLGVVLVCTALDGLLGVCPGCRLAVRLHALLEGAEGVAD